MISLTFVIGGARSGKSKYAEELAMKSHAGISQNNKNLHYLATAQTFDNEMRERIAEHQKRRNTDWQTTEAPINLPEKIKAVSHPNAVILVDCLSVWVTNLLINKVDLETSFKLLFEEIKFSPSCIICVASETGLGIVPDNALSRQFRDANGKVNQMLAVLADEVYFMVAGIPQKIKP